MSNVKIQYFFTLNYPKCKRNIIKIWSNVKFILTKCKINSIL